MPPPSSGGIALMEMVNMIELANLDSIEFNSAKYVRLIAEVMRRAYADCAEFPGDPDFNQNMPLEKLTSKAFAKKCYDNIDMTKASLIMKWETLMLFPVQQRITDKLEQQ
jgi:gamma-glutamyltranspeptidase/glutathione hydrolase